MEERIADPGLRRTHAPDYPVGCKRILISDDYFRALARPNVAIASGKVINDWSGFTVGYWWRTLRPDFAAFEARTRAALHALPPVRAPLAS